MKSRWFSPSSLLATAFIMAAMLETSLGAPLREDVVKEPRGECWVLLEGHCNG